MLKESGVGMTNLKALGGASDFKRNENKDCRFITL